MENAQQPHRASYDPRERLGVSVGPGPSILNPAFLVPTVSCCRFPPKPGEIHSKASGKRGSGSPPPGKGLSSGPSTQSLCTWTHTHTPLPLWRSVEKKSVGKEACVQNWELSESLSRGLEVAGFTLSPPRPLVLPRLPSSPRPCVHLWTRLTSPSGDANAVLFWTKSTMFGVQRKGRRDTGEEQGRIQERRGGRRQTDRMTDPDRETGTEKAPENP